MRDHVHAPSGHAVAGQPRRLKLRCLKTPSRLDQAARMIVRVTLIGGTARRSTLSIRPSCRRSETTLFSQSLDRFGQDRLLKAMNVAETEDTAALRESGAAFWCPLSGPT